MIKLMIVAGNSTDKLADFLENRGTFSVQNRYDNFSNLDEIQNEIINVDKLLYLYKDSENSDVSIKSEMQALKTLLGTSGFFTVREIVFMLGTSDESKTAIRYFTTVMQDCKYENYSIKQLQGVASYSAIYDSLMGVSESRDFNNSYKKLYRVERNSDSDLAYKAENNSDLVIEPFSYTGVSEYDSRKKIAAKVDSGNVFTDAKDSEMEMYDAPHFGELEYDGEFNASRVHLVTGDSKSGKTLWSTILAGSARTAGRTVCVFDFTSKLGTDTLLKQSNIAFEIKTMKELLYDAELAKDNLYVCSSSSEKENAIKFEFMQNLFTRPLKAFDDIFIIADLAESRRIADLLHDRIDDYLITVIQKTADLLIAATEIDTVISKIPTVRPYVILNGVIMQSALLEQMQAKEAKELFGSDVTVVNGKLFSTLTFSKVLYESIFKKR